MKNDEKIIICRVGADVILELLDEVKHIKSTHTKISSQYLSGLYFNAKECSNETLSYFYEADKMHSLLRSRTFSVAW